MNPGTHYLEGQNACTAAEGEVRPIVSQVQFRQKDVRLEGQESSWPRVRVGLSGFALLYFAGVSFFGDSAPPNRLLVVLVLYSLFAIAVLIAPKRELRWPRVRRFLALSLDLSVNTLFMVDLGATGAVAYPTYLGIILANGMQFGRRPMIVAHGLGNLLFAVALLGSDLWRLQPSLGLALQAGLIFMPLLFHPLIENLKELNSSLVQGRDEAVQANQTKSRFLAELSHDLRTPMNAIVGLSEVLSDESLDPHQQGLVAELSNSSSLLVGLVDDVLDMTRIELRDLVMEEKRFVPAEVVRSVHSMLVVEARQKGLLFRYEVDEYSNRAVWGDRRRIAEALTNLVVNALKFTRHGEVLVISRFVKFREEKPVIRFAVHDSGCGIHPSKVKDIFRPYVQGSRAVGSSEGLGLGLSIVQRIVDAMNGDLQVESTAGVGSRFWFEVPLSVAPSSTGSVNLTQPLLGVSEIAQERAVLVVDDDRVNRLVATLQLRALGAQVETVSTGEAALEELSRKSFSAVLMDSRLPGLDGPATTKAIRAGESEGVRIPIVGLSAWALPEERERGLASGMDTFLTKPYRRQELAAVLAPWLQLPSQAMVREDLLEARSLDVDQLTLAIGGWSDEPDFVDQLISTFQQQGESCLSAFEVGIDEGDYEGIAEAAHRLKGAAATLGALQLAGRADVIERMAVEEPAALSQSDIGSLRGELGLAVRDLIEALSSNEPMA